MRQLLEAEVRMQSGRATQNNARDKGHSGWRTEKKKKGGRTGDRQQRDEKKQNTKALKQLKWRVDERMKAEERARERELQKEKREFCLKMMKDSQHEVLLPAGQVAPDSNGCALHILYL